MLVAPGKEKDRAAASWITPRSERILTQELQRDQEIHGTTPFLPFIRVQEGGSF
jgi:hypothetical protein